MFTYESTGTRMEMDEVKQVHLTSCSVSNTHSDTHTHTHTHTHTPKKKKKEKRTRSESRPGLHSSFRVMAQDSSLFASPRNQRSCEYR